MDCGNRDEFDVAVSTFIERLGMVSQARAQPDLEIKMPSAAVDVVRAHLTAMLDKVKRINIVSKHARSDEVNVFPLKDYERLERELGGLIGNLPAETP